MMRDIMANIDQFFPSCPHCAVDQDLEEHVEYSVEN